MLILTFRNVYENYSPISIAISYKDIFQIAWILENSKEVHYFTVSDGHGLLFPNDFGFGPFKKWTDLLYKKEESNLSE